MLIDITFKKLFKILEEGLIGKNTLWLKQFAPSSINPSFKAGGYIKQWVLALAKVILHIKNYLKILKVFNYMQTFHLPKF